MNGEDAAAALAQVDHTRRRLAASAHWPFHRHAMFGLAEGLLVAGLAQPWSIAVPMFGAAFALLVVCVFDDRRRHGMFVSGWQAGNTRPLTIALTVVVLGLGGLAALIRDPVSAQPLGYLLGALAFVLCTAASLWWERIYRAELTGGVPR